MYKPTRRTAAGRRWALAAALLLPATMRAAVSHGFSVPAGFEISLFAGDDLAHDIYSMTTDHEGRIVVASRGWVKILHDTDGDGKADRATVFAEFPKSGAQGMYFDEEGLVVSGDQGVRRWRDRDGDGKADREPEVLLQPANGGEHGAHAIRKGPDGWLYLMAGNETGIGSQHINLPGSPVKQVVAGSMVRFSPDGKSSEVVAHGFRNAYDFDFHPLGQMLTYDSDGERDHHLPWYSGTRIFDVAVGAAHGWILRGSPHAWSRPESWFDNTERLWTVGRGSPTGVVVYNHHAFPARYQGGVFTVCWTLGKVYFSPLTRAGSTFRAELETFMEAKGANGFAPVAVVVGPNGDLFVAIGGRGTIGSVFRVHPTGRPAAAPETADRLRQVLAADQPLASWSRAKWVPLAKQLGAQAFEQAAANPRLALPERIRAVEVLVEIFAGLRPEAAQKLTGDPEAELVARVAWALPRSAQINHPAVALAALTRRDDPRIARAAWEALQSVPFAPDAAADAPDWYRGFESDDRRVRAAAVLVARGSGIASFASAYPPPEATDRQRLGPLKVFGAERPEAPQWTPHFFNTCVDAFLRATHPDTRRDAVRLLLLGLGDVSPIPGQPDTFDGLVGAKTKEISAALRARVVDRLAPAFPTGETDVDRELARLLAVLGAEAPGLLEQVVAKLTETSAVEDDIYYLMIASRLPGSRTQDLRDRIAGAVANLHPKMNAHRHEPSRYWGVHVGAMFARLLARDPALAPALVAAPNFRLPAQALFAAALPSPHKESAARALLAKAPAPGNAAAAWTREFIDFVTVLPVAESFAALRPVWSIPSLRDPIALVLAGNPQAEDRDRFVTALASFQSPVVERAARALLKIGGSAAPPEVGVAIAALRRQCRLQKDKSVRGALAELLASWTGQSFTITEGTDLLQSYAPWFAWFAATHPMVGMGGVARDEDAVTWAKRLAVVNWEAGNPAHGRRVFEERLCHSCHGGSRIGPDLTGITARFSREDLFAKILAPSRELSPQWQGVQFDLRNGATHIGVVVYESPTATLLQTGPDTTIRLTGDEVISVQPSRTSLMPPGLLAGLKDQEVADFYAFMKTLKK